MKQPSAFNRHSDEIETELKSLIMEQSLPLYRMMAYHMGWMDDQGEQVRMNVGERIHSTLCVLTCAALGGEISKAMPAAASLELVHNFSQIHNDIQEGTPAQGINAGDGMHALARLSLLRQAENGIPAELALRAMATLDTACLHLCEGQYLDLTYQERVDISQAAYFQMVEGKTAALISCATELGALMASANEKSIKAMTLFGQKLGIAFQIRNDILDLWRPQNTDTPPAGVLLNKRKSLPIVYALQTASGAEKRALGDVYFKRVMEPEDIEKVIEVLDRLGAREFSQETADALCQEAIQVIGEAGPSSDGMDELSNVARFLVTRDL
jgi:geranylgeranyl diphosphate synthase type I